MQDDAAAAAHGYRDDDCSRGARQVSFSDMHAALRGAESLDDLSVLRSFIKENKPTWRDWKSKREDFSETWLPHEEERLRKVPAGFTMLHHLVLRHKHRAVRQFCEEGVLTPALNMRCTDLLATPLMYAVMEQDEKMAVFLASQQRGQLGLYTTLEGERVSAIALAKKRECSPSSVAYLIDCFGGAEALLFSAVQYDALFDVRIAIQAMARSHTPMNRLCRDQLTPLFMAAFLGHLEVARVLLEEGKVEADWTPSQNDWTPLMIAARRGDEPMCALLSQHGARVSYYIDRSDTQPHDSRHWSALTFAAEGGHKDLYRQLRLQLRRTDQYFPNRLESDIVTRWDQTDRGAAVAAQL